MVKALLSQTKRDWNLAKKLAVKLRVGFKFTAHPLASSLRPIFPVQADCSYCMVTFLRRTGEDSCCAAWLRSHLSAQATETAELSTGDSSHDALSCSGDFTKTHGQGCDLIWNREWFVTKDLVTNIRSPDFRSMPRLAAKVGSIRSMRGQI